jgi:hypothetical protein
VHALKLVVTVLAAVVAGWFVYVATYFGLAWWEASLLPVAALGLLVVSLWA